MEKRKWLTIPCLLMPALNIWMIYSFELVLTSPLYWCLAIILNQNTLRGFYISTNIASIYLDHLIGFHHSIVANSKSNFLNPKTCRVLSSSKLISQETLYGRNGQLLLLTDSESKRENTTSKVNGYATLSASMQNVWVLDDINFLC